MLIVSAKSAFALIFGGALLGQQADDANRDVAPPAPPAPAVEASRAAEPDNNRENQQAAENQAQQNREQAQRQRSDDQAQQRDQAARKREVQNDRQTYQNEKQSGQRDTARDQQGRSALGVSLSSDLRVIEVSPGSPAERMGLRSRDEILSMNGETFNSIDAFIETVSTTPQDQEIQLEIDRDGKNMTQSGRLGAWDQVHYSGTRTAAMGMQHQAPQEQYTDQGAMSYDQGYGQANGGQFAGDACCCDPCAGFGGYGQAGFGQGGWNDGLSRREARRAARRGHGW